MICRRVCCILGRPFSNSCDQRGIQQKYMKPPLTSCDNYIQSADASFTNLRHVSDQVEGDIREGLVEIPTHYVHPGEAVARVGVRFIQSHDMSKVGELGVLLLKANLYTNARCISF